LEIRVLTLEDTSVHARELIEILHEILVSNYPALTLTHAEKCYHNMRGFMQDNSAIVFGAFCGDVLVGVQWGHEVSHFDQKRVHCAMIGVKEEYRRQDIGSRLLRELEIVAFSRGLQQVELMVTSENAAAVRYYAKNGFRIERLKMVKSIESVMQ